MPAQAIAGGIAGAASWLPPIFCIDVVKTKMQSAPRGTYKGIIDCARKSFQQEGLPVFSEVLESLCVEHFRCMERSF